jgi:hypothetical protein
VVDFDKAIEWANKNGHKPYVARVRHLNDKHKAAHWRAAYGMRGRSGCFFRKWEPCRSDSTPSMGGNRRMFCLSRRAPGMPKYHAPNFLISVSADIVEDVLAFHF